MIMGRVHYGDVFLVQRFPSCFESVVDLVCHRETARACGIALSVMVESEEAALPAPTTTTLYLSPAVVLNNRALVGTRRARTFENMVKVTEEQCSRRSTGGS